MRNTPGNNSKDPFAVSNNNNNACTIQRKLSLSKKAISDDAESFLPQAAASTADVTEKSYKNTAVNRKQPFHENSVENVILQS